jgi:hypothetical protein
VNVRTRWRMWPRKGTLKVIQHPPLWTTIFLKFSPIIN